MEYFVTGASGFIGKRLVRKLLARRGAVVHFLIRPESQDKVATLHEYWGVDGRRARPVVGDLTQPLLGLSAANVEALSGQIDHFFHLAAIYDLTASAESQMAANIDGTRHAVALANAIGAKRFQHMSSVAVAGLYDGIFREDMFDEAEHLEHPYFASKHEAERIVRTECTMPWRAYRPSMVVGDSKTGEMDKVDGPYYLFKMIQRMRRIMPPWLPAVGVDGGRSNMVPVDFVVDATDHIAHGRDGDRRAFHLVDPVPYRMGDVLNIFAQAAHAPKFALKVNPAALMGFIPAPLRKGLLSLAPVQRIRDNILNDLGLPRQLLEIGDFNTRFDCRDANAALKGSGIECPRLEDYGYRLWDYWERNLDPDLFVDRTLAGQVKGRVVLITGGSQGIGLASAHRTAHAGAITVLAARDPVKLAAAKEEIEAALGDNPNGGRVVTIEADLSDMDSCDALVARLVQDYGGVDVLVNNAGRSIRRGIESSYDRFHDFQRTMQLNYFGCLKVTLGLLPHMVARKRGHVVNVSTMGVLTNAPRFSAYVASKAALDAWTRCAASEYIDTGVTFTTINMPLVKTAMIAPTKIYNNIPTLTPEQAADMVVEAIIDKPVRIAPREGVIGQLLHAVAPRMMQILMNAGFRMFGDSERAKGVQGGGGANPEQVAFANLVKGVHM